MQKLIKWLEEKFVPVAQKIGQQSHLAAIRDGFVAITPLIMAGALAVLLNNVLFTPGSILGTLLDVDADNPGWWFDFTGKYLVPVMGNIWWGTLAVMSLIVTFTIAYKLAEKREVDPLSAGVIALAAFLSLVPQVNSDAWGNFGWQYFNGGALLVALIVTLVVTEIYAWFVNKNITIKMPENVPPAVGKAFAAIIPGFIAIAFASSVPVILTSFEVERNIFELITAFVTEPLSHAGQSLIGAISYVFFIQIFWFMGLHGGNILGAVTQAVYLPANVANIDGATNVFTTAFFDSYVHLGGAGATLSLLIAIFLVSKRKDYRDTSKIAVSGSVFQINEPVMFGLPVILNAYLLLPFVFIPIILTIVAYIATVSGFAGYTNNIIPWTTPPVIGAYFATSGSIGAAITALFNLGLAVVLYIPFVMMANRES